MIFFRPRGIFQLEGNFFSGGEVAVKRLQLYSKKTPWFHIHKKYVDLFQRNYYIGIITVSLLVYNRSFYFKKSNFFACNNAVNYSNMPLGSSKLISETGSKGHYPFLWSSKEAASCMIKYWLDTQEQFLGGLIART